jgi:hypothetical protein
VQFENIDQIKEHITSRNSCFAREYNSVKLGRVSLEFYEHRKNWTLERFAAIGYVETNERCKRGIKVHEQHELSFKTANEIDAFVENLLAAATKY